MNTSKLTSTVKAATSWQQTRIVKGVKLAGAAPKVGNGATHGINGDSYGFIITEVAEDGTWFKYKGSWSGKAWLCTRRNSPLCGRYVMTRDWDWGYDENRKPSMNYRDNRYNVIWALDTVGQPETVLDPSF